MIQVGTSWASVYACYLPPSNSSRGDHSQEFYDTLKSLVIDNYQLGDFVICGDFNARCDRLTDSPADSLGIPDRTPIDLTVNAYGRELIDTMKALDLCMLNGRFDPVSTKGLAVVDYTV